MASKRSILMLLLLLIIGSACGSCRIRTPRGTGAPVTAQSIDINLEPGQLVTLPAGTQSQMLHYTGLLISHNSRHHQPNWVAWQLTRDKALADSVSRKYSKFIPDDNATGGADLSDYRNSGMTRGHMCPAADMKWSPEAMDACFRLSNICPQAHELNAGAWNTLEDKCRQWAIRDSVIYIICGPVLSDYGLKTIGENQVTVPERFFKVVLAPYADPPRAIGFVMPNGKVSGGMNSTAMSIDQVEEITGFDFFPFLPDDVETVIESECNLSLWNRRR